MEIQQLRHLIAAVQHGNLQKAAEICNITQSGLSRSISSLETRLGVPLLVRKPKGVEATSFGLVVIERAKVIVNEVARSLEEVRAMEGGRIGAVNLGITQNFARYLIPDLLQKVHADRPNIQFNVFTGGFVELIDRLKYGTIDAVFGLLGNVQPSEDLTIEILRDHYSRVIARAQHPLVPEPGLTIDRLARARWAMLNGEGLQRNFLSFFEQEGHASPDQILKTDSIDLIRRFVLDTDVLTVLPVDAVREEIESGLLRILDCDTPAEMTQVCLIFRSAGLMTPQLKLISDEIRRWAGAPRRRAARKPLAPPRVSSQAPHFSLMVLC